MKKEDQTYQTVLLSFTSKEDATMVANVFEQHYKERGHYPNNQVTYELPLEIEFHASEPFSYFQELQSLYIMETEESIMYDFCAINRMELMILSNLQEEPTMKIMNFELPTQTLKELLEKTLE